MLDAVEGDPDPGDEHRVLMVRMQRDGLSLYAKQGSEAIRAIREPCAATTELLDRACAEVAGGLRSIEFRDHNDEQPDDGGWAES